jgi:predicted transcriptional regulator
MCAFNKSAKKIVKKDHQNGESMDEFSKFLVKPLDDELAYRGRKQSVSISLSPKTIEFLDSLAEPLGLDRSKIIEYVLSKSRNLRAELESEQFLARVLGYASSAKMKRRIRRAVERKQRKKGG